MSEDTREALLVANQALAHLCTAMENLEQQVRDIDQHVRGIDELVDTLIDRVVAIEERKA